MTNLARNSFQVQRCLRNTEGEEKTRGAEAFTVSTRFPSVLFSAYLGLRSSLFRLLVPTVLKPRDLRLTRFPQQVAYSREQRVSLVDRVEGRKHTDLHINHDESRICTHGKIPLLQPPAAHVRSCTRTNPQWDRSEQLLPAPVPQYTPKSSKDSSSL